MPSRDRSHYRGSYDTRAKRVRDLAYGDPATTCWRCGRTLAQARASDPDVTWHAGHVFDGDPNSPLMPEHSSCNQSAGAKAGHKRRELNPSRRWY